MGLVTYLEPGSVLAEGDLVRFGHAGEMKPIDPACYGLVIYDRGYASFFRPLKDSSPNPEIRVKTAAEAALDDIADVFGIGSEARKDFSTIVTNAQNCRDQQRKLQETLRAVLQAIEDGKHWKFGITIDA